MHTLIVFACIRVIFCNTDMREVDSKTCFSKGTAKCFCGERFGLQLSGVNFIAGTTMNFVSFVV